MTPTNLDDLSLIALHELSQKIRTASRGGWPTVVWFWKVTDQTSVHASEISMPADATEDDVLETLEERYQDAPGFHVWR